MGREGAAAKAGDGGIEMRHAHLQAGIGIGEAEPARVMQVERERDIGIGILHRANDLPDALGRGPGHGVAQADEAQLLALIPRDGAHVRDQLDNALDRDIALEVAAEGGSDEAGAHRNGMGLIHGDQLRLGGKLLGRVAVLVALEEGVGGIKRQLAFHVQSPGGDGAFQPALVEPQAGIVHAGLRGETGHHGLRIRHARHFLRMHEGGDLNVIQPGAGQRVDETDLLFRADRAFLDLEAFARPLLLDMDTVGQTGHGAYSSTMTVERPPKKPLTERTVVPLNRTAITLITVKRPRS